MKQLVTHHALQLDPEKKRILEGIEGEERKWLYNLYMLLFDGNFTMVSSVVESILKENEEKENETVPTKTKDSVIEVPTVVTASDLLAFVNEEDNREGSRMFKTASSALEWAKKHNYDFPNYMKD